MICQTCSGSGTLPVLAFDHRHGRRPIFPRDEPCPNCIGGIVSCCDSAGSAQPEPKSAPEPENNAPF